LLELCKAVVVVLQEHSGNDAQHLFVHTAVHSFSSFAGTLRPRAVTSLPDNAYCLATGITSTGTRRAVAATLLKDNSTLSLNGRSKILWCYTSASTLQLGTGTDTKLWSWITCAAHTRKGVPEYNHGSINVLHQFNAICTQSHRPRAAF
jgi:hypothetical protein